MERELHNCKYTKTAPPTETEQKDKGCVNSETTKNAGKAAEPQLTWEILLTLKKFDLQSGDSIMKWRCFSSALTRKQVKGNMDEAKYRPKLQQTLLEAEAGAHLL